MKTTIHNLALTFLCLFTMLVAKGQNPYTYDTSKLPQNVILGGAGSKVDASIPIGVSQAYGLGVYATKVADGLYEYQQFNVQGGSVTISAGAAGYLGTLFGKVTLMGVAAPGASFTPPSKTAAGAVGNIQQLGGHGFIGIHTFNNGNKLILGAGGTRNFSNQAQINSWDAHVVVGVTF